MSGFLVFDNISKSFGAAKAVNAVSLEIGRGEIFSLLGPSGCGKTTLLRMAAGFETPDTGRILLDGKDITHMPPNQRPVNTVFQNYALFPHLSVRDNIAFGPRIAGVSADVNAMLQLVKLEPHAHKKPAQLSGGQKQRVAIARALINKPQVLLLDEPLAALDLKLRQHLLMELLTIHRQVGTTFIYVTHDQTEAIGLSDYIAVMNEGRVEQCGAPREIYESPRTSFVAAFIGDTNFITGEVVSCEAHASGTLCRLKTEALGEVTARILEPLPVGAAVRLSVRPEAWTVTSTRSPNAIRCRIEDVLYLGATSSITMSAGTQRLIVHRSNRQEDDTAFIKRGGEAWASFHPEDAVALPLG
ncbi:MAG: transporter ATP-binding protein [Verrucomicrobiaceae bacterium]|nr:transporter ATP-binding protein [Verrucomicrobiaceae bacterium]